jgi:hypothetical protein
VPPQLRPPPTVAHNNTGGGRLEPEAEAPRARSLRGRHDVVVDQNHPARAGAAGKKINVGHLYVVGARRERRVRGDAFHCSRFSWRWGRDRGMGNGRWGAKLRGQVTTTGHLLRAGFPRT